MSTKTKPSIVFCHGIWADGWCFNKVIPTLQADGHQVIAAQYGLDTIAGDVAAVRRTLGRVGSPTILVGHSYGGAVITAAGTDDRVAGLVYIAAVPRMPARRCRASWTSSQRQPSSPTSQSPMGESGCFRKASSISPETSPRGAEGRLGDALRPPRTCSPEARWRRLEIEASSYIVATDDHAVHPELQRFVAKRMRATISEVDSSHVPMLSKPGLVIDVIRTAATAVR